MRTIQDNAVPLFEEIVKGYDSRPASDVAESRGMREARKAAFEQFRLLGFPTIRHEDWKYTNLSRFLKEEYSVGGAAGGAKVAADAKVAAAVLPAAAVIPGLDALRVVLVNGTAL